MSSLTIDVTGRGYVTDYPIAAETASEQVPTGNRREVRAIPRSRRSRTARTRIGHIASIQMIKQRPSAVHW